MSCAAESEKRLVRALRASLDSAFLTLRGVTFVTSRWESATFSGWRHEGEIVVSDDPALDRWLTTIAEAELPMKGQFVADLAVRVASRTDGLATVNVEALTLEES